MFVFVNPWAFYNQDDEEEDVNSSSGSESFHEGYHKKVDEERYQGKASKELLDTYLEDASFFMKYDGKREAAKEAKEILSEDGVRKELLSKVSEEDIAKKEKELKAQAKAAPFKAKANYAMDAEAFNSPAFAINLGASALPGMVIMASSAKQESLAVLLAGAAATVGGLMAAHKIPDLTRGKNPEERKAIDDYYDVKHSLVALKQLKRAIQKENGTSNLQMAKKFLAEGYGNPGGMITVPAIAKRKANGR